MPNWIDEQMQKQRFEDMARTAQRDRLAQRALVARVQRVRFHRPILARLGCWLEACGYRLQVRYGAPPDVAIVGDSRGNTARC